MRIGIASLSRDWSLIGALFVVDAALLLTTNFRLVWWPEYVIMAATLFLASIALVYSRYRKIPSLANMANTGALLVLFTNLAAIFNYVLAGIMPLPLWDASFDAADKALGLNWMSMYDWVGSHSLIHPGITIVYFTLGPELILLLLLLEGLGRHRHAVELRHCFMSSAIVTILFGILMPAAGPFVFYHLPIAEITGYVSQEAGLRDGSFRVINMANAEGLVAFPSFHAALAVLCAYAARSLTYLRLPVLLLNLLIVLSSPAIGGHYYVDIFAGLVLAIVAIAADRRVTAEDFGEATESSTVHLRTSAPV